MKTLKKMSFNLAVNELSRSELKGIMAGSGSNYDNLWKCCWDTDPTKCSQCAGYGTCTGNSHLKKC